MVRCDFFGSTAFPGFAATTQSPVFRSAIFPPFFLEGCFSFGTGGDCWEGFGLAGRRKASCYSVVSSSMSQPVQKILIYIYSSPNAALLAPGGGTRGKEKSATRGGSMGLLHRLIWTNIRQHVFSNADTSSSLLDKGPINNLNCHPLA